jgi:hypothetical protein
MQPRKDATDRTMGPLPSALVWFQKYAPQVFVGLHQHLDIHLDTDLRMRLSLVMGCANERQKCNQILKILITYGAAHGFTSASCCQRTEEKRCHRIEQVLLEWRIWLTDTPW